MNKKPLEQVQNIKYLGIIIDSKLKFGEHIMYISGKCTKLMHTLSKSAEQCWGALCTIHTGAILPTTSVLRRRYGLRHWKRNATKQYTTEYSAS